jgi:Ca-activated chloride channel family protein
MKPRLILLIVLVVSLSIMFASPVQADGIIIPDPPICDPMPCPIPPVPHPIMSQLVIRYHHVAVTIDQQVALTHVDQVFVNPNEWAVEGTYIFPLPQDAAVANFTLWVDGQPVQGEVLTAEQARATYEEIVRSQRDPALLEYAGRGAVQARIFPIPAHGERRIELEYSQVLTADNGLVRYSYPLNTEKFSQKALESVSVSVEIRSSQAVRAVYSTSHALDILRVNDRHVLATYKAENVLPDVDFNLYYSLGESEAFHLLTYRDASDPSDPDGFFLLLMAPRPDSSGEAVAKDVILVLDHSGSMEGEKFRQAQVALSFILTHLNPEDRFNVIAFSTAVESYASALRSSGETPQAAEWVARLSARGSTDINRALLEAASMADKERPTYIIFLTDGLPTVGETDSQRIIENFVGAASANLRLFAFGVGYDVDTFLLDSLTAAHHGTSTYVLPGDAIDEIISGFYAKISTPVLTDLSLDFGRFSVYDIYPQPLPDLFLGSQIVAVGRYRQGGVTNITLSGHVEDLTQQFRYDEQVFAQDNHAQGGGLASIPRLWATRKVGFLLNQVRLHGADQETIDQIVRLSIRYGIVTPYTSYLVTEPQALGAAAQERIANDTYHNLQTTPTAAPSGKDAVQQAAGAGGMQGADAAAAGPAELASQVRIIGSRTFLFTNNTWTDTRYDPDAMSTVKVAFLSPDYFALAQSDPSLADALALGEQVIVVAGEVVYEVVPEGTMVTPLADLPTPKATPAVQGTPVAQAASPTPDAASGTPASGTAPSQTPVPGSGLAPTPAPGFRLPTCLAGLLPLGAVLALWWIRRKL